MNTGMGKVGTMFDLNGAAWRKSTRSDANANCVEMAGNLPGVVAVWDSKHPGGAVLVVTADEWSVSSAVSKNKGSTFNRQYSPRTMVGTVPCLAAFATGEEANA